MAGGFERVLFLKDIEHQTMSIADIVARYNVSVNTARNWVKLDKIIKIDGSYPYLFTHADNNNVVAPDSSVRQVGKAIGRTYHDNCLTLHSVTNDQLDKAIESTLVAKTTVGEILSSITNQAELDSVEARLISLVQIARRYYERDVKD